VKTALITTAGFRDVIEIARGNRPDLFNFNFRKPRPFVDRYLRAELVERSNFRGDLVRPSTSRRCPRCSISFGRKASRRSRWPFFTPM
jgi:N-methylhydantoinase A